MARPSRRVGGRNGCPSRLLTPVSSREGAQAPCRVRPQSAPFRTRARHKDPSMSNILVINASGQETRVALIEQGTISEYYLERKNEKGIVGNVYKGRVVRVDRKSTRLNSSHLVISYAVFCLKKKIKSTFCTF